MFRDVIHGASPRGEKFSLFVGTARGRRKQEAKMNTNGHGKLFGVALDASDNSWNLQLKRASLWAQRQSKEA